MLKNRNYSLQELKNSLQKEGINTIVRNNDEGLVYGLTYVDNKTKCVFNGSDLGKAYSAKGIQERCVQNEQLRQDESQKHQQPTKHNGHQNSSANKEQTLIIGLITPPSIGNAVEEMLQPTETKSYVPHQLKKTRKKKRKKIYNNQ